MKKCPTCGKVYETENTLCPSDGAVLERMNDALIGVTLAGKYRVEELINEGGMGAVYRSTHVLMDKVVAIKVLHPSLAADPKIVARFSREARAASRLSHPHALSVTDFGEDEGGVVFLVMEYLKGRTLKDLIQAEGPLSISRVVEIVRQVSGALEAAHNEGVVHRDLKSDNIMLVDVGSDDDWAKVLDFGIAKITEKVGKDPALTNPNLIIGTPQYMSPEQCSQAGELDSRSDIYSLGIIVYEMLIGHVPFTGESPTAIMMKHLQEAPPSVLDERRDVPPAVDQVVARALAKSPDDRFQTVRELADALADAAAGIELAGAAASATGDAPVGRATDRIVVPTGMSEPSRETIGDSADEITVIRPRIEDADLEEEELFATDLGAPSDGMRRWRFIVPIAAGLLIVAAVVLALTRNSSTESQINGNSPALTIEPGSQSVQPAQTPTGSAEQGIAPSAPVATPDANVATPPESEPGRNTNSGSPGPDPNAKSGANGNENSGETTPTPSPSTNTNRRVELPQPSTTATPKPLPSEPPPPAPNPVLDSEPPRP